MSFQKNLTCIKCFKTKKDTSISLIVTILGLVLFIASISQESFSGTVIGKGFIFSSHSL